ncbi:hypothetical protein [Burkholderia sp. NLJ2]|uniref:hypothetical protein n=1 Tax=Burkholderia sp. NLJ2 TaxID=3090699 RepID=UPI003C6C0D90
MAGPHVAGLSFVRRANGPGTNHEAAATTAISEFARRGFEFMGIADNKIREIAPDKWDEHVNHAWREFVACFPTQP